MIAIDVEMQAMSARLFFKKLTKVIFLAPSYFFYGAYVLLTRFGTEISYKIKAKPKIPERT
jgi:hypothetical protein